MSALWLLNPNLSQEDIIQLTEQKVQAGKEFLDTVKAQLDGIDDHDERMKHLGFSMSLYMQFFML